MKILMMALLFMPLMALADELPDEVKTEKVDGVVWHYAQRQSFESSYSIITFPDEVMVGFGASLYQIHVSAIPTDTVGVVSVPAFLGGKPVTAICPRAFQYCNKVTGVRIPSCVKFIGDKAFSDCDSLMSVVMEGDAPDVGLEIFSGTPKRMVVSVPNGSIGWNGGVTAKLPESWCGRAIVHSGETYDWGGGTGVVQKISMTVTNVIEHYTTVTNVVVVEHYTTVTNVVKLVPGGEITGPTGVCSFKAGQEASIMLQDAAGCDAFGVPDGMAWDKATGSISGTATRSGTYDILLVSGSGASTMVMRTTVVVQPFDKIVGYVGVDFSRGGMPLGILKSYAKLPAGLKWNKKTLLLSGIPTKAQTLNLETSYGEPVQIEIKALPNWATCSYYGRARGSIGDSVSASRDAVAITLTSVGKISAKVQTPKKTFSFSSKSWSSFEVGGSGLPDDLIFRQTLALKTGETLNLVLRGCGCSGKPELLGTITGGTFADDHDILVHQDVYAKSGKNWLSLADHEEMSKCVGTYILGFEAAEAIHIPSDGSSLKQWNCRLVDKAESLFLKVVLKEDGTATVTGKVPSGTKIVSCTTKAWIDENGFLNIMPNFFPGKSKVVKADLLFSGCEQKQPKLEIGYALEIIEK